MANDSEPSPAQRKAALLWAAVSKFATKNLIRKHLREGSQARVDLQIVGKCRPGGAIAEAVAGELTIGQSAISTSSADVALDQLGALLAEAIPVDTWRRIQKELPAYFAANGKLPPPENDARIEEFDNLREQLRTRKSTTRSAAISFRPTK